MLLAKEWFKRMIILNIISTKTFSLYKSKLVTRIDGFTRIIYNHASCTKVNYVNSKKIGYKPSCCGVVSIASLVPDLNSFRSVARPSG